MKICIATSTRADWGLLSPLAHALKDSGDVSLDILATNMHLLEKYGMTVDEIIADGFNVSARIPIDCDTDGEASRVKAMAECMRGTAEALASLQPDLLIILGDRYEMLAIAAAAAVMKVPIIHIAGGEISEGAVDDSIRHAITKLSSLHFTATEEYRRRVIQMGENPAFVINSGALGVWNIMHQTLLDKTELIGQLLDLGCTNAEEIINGKPLLIATFHPATLDDRDSSMLCENMLHALDEFPDYNIIATYPNNDAGSEGIISSLNKWYDPTRIMLIKSLGMRRYLSALKLAKAVVGNSSSGIVEVPSMGIPTVDIGIRQRGRICAPSVIHCGDSKSDIQAAIKTAIGDDMQRLASDRVNPYYKENTVGIMTETILNCDPSVLQPKHFYDIHI